jgi:integrase
VSGGWIDPEAGRVLLPVYATAWIDERPGLRPKTIQLYRYLMRAHLQEAFGSTTIAGITEADVRRWPADMLSAGVTPVTAAKAYRLLKAIMATAVDDGLIRRNPCRIKGASVKKSPERPVLTIGEVYALADAIGPRYRALVLLACQPEADALVFTSPHGMPLRHANRCQPSPPGACPSWPCSSRTR